MRYCVIHLQLLRSLHTILCYVWGSFYMRIIYFSTISYSEKQLREWTATYSVDERGSVLDGLFAFVSGIFAKGEEKKVSTSSSSSSSGPDVAQVIINQWRWKTIVIMPLDQLLIYIKNLLSSFLVK